MKPSKPLYRWANYFGPWSDDPHLWLNYSEEAAANTRLRGQKTVKVRITPIPPRKSKPKRGGRRKPMD
jgi:hypothetical protein